MELKLKYQYTYFIKPFVIEEDKYIKYILSLLNNNKCKLKVFEKERDLNLYSYFLPKIREYFFPSFSLSKDRIDSLEREKNNVIKAYELAKLPCNIFEYKLDERVQGKVDEEDGIFFNIEKIEIICLDTGICFLAIKTNIENTDSFSDLLNYNYKLKDINSDFRKLKDYNNIKVQTDTFGNMDEFSDFIDNIIGVNGTEKLKDIDLYNKRFFVYTYSCIDQDNWNNEEDFKNIENDFIKYTNVLSNNSTINFNETELQDTIQEIKPFKYAKFGFTKQSASLMTSSVDINNYTKILFDYENEYLYTLIICLHQRIYLKMLENVFNGKIDLKIARKRFSKYTEEILAHEITNSLTGTMFYKKWKDIFELNEIYNQIKIKSDLIYKELKVDNNFKTNKMILTALIISLILNLINFFALTKL